MLPEDLREQMEVAPGTLGLGKKSSHHLARGIIDGPDQTQWRTPPFKLVMRGAIDLEHHSISGQPLSPASMLNPAPLLG